MTYFAGAAAVPASDLAAGIWPVSFVGAGVVEGCGVVDGCGVCA